MEKSMSRFNCGLSRTNAQSLYFKVMPLVKEFCAENNLPYLVDDYFTGWKLGVAQFENIAALAAKLKHKVM